MNGSPGEQFCNAALCWISGKIIENNLSYVFSHVHLCIIVRAGRGSKSTAKECDFPQRLIARQFSGLIPVIPFSVELQRTRETIETPA